jgi:hypothetical protein
MKPIFRETVVDRRQPQIRWTAVLAGTALALALWNLLNLLFVGGAMTAIDPDELDAATAMGIGSGIGSVLAPLLAMFAGGLLAGRLAAHYDRRVSGGHGALVWALTSVLGLVIMANVAGNFVDKRMLGMHGAAASAPPAGTSALIDDEVRQINLHLKSQSAPTIETTDFLDAARYAAGSDGRSIDRDAFVSRLDANTKLSRPEAEAVLDQLGPSSPDVILAAQQLALHRQQALEVAESTGNALLGAGAALFLCLACAIAGAVFGARALGDRRGAGGPRYQRPTTIPGPAPGPAANPNVVVTSDADVYRDARE